MGETVVQPKKRMVEQDIAKSIGILIVVLVHSAQIKTTTMNMIVATTGYAMPFFFFMSGYNYKPGRGSWGKNVVKRLKQIFLPLVFYSVGVYGVMLIYFLIRKEATVMDALCSFVSFWLTRPLTTWIGLEVPMTNPFSGLLVQGWFLQFMITGYLIFYAVADYALKKVSRLISVNIALLAVTCVLTHYEITLPWGIHAAPLIASMMLFGAWFGQYKLLHNGTVPLKWNIPNTIFAFGIYFVLGLLYPKAGQFAGGMLGHNIGFWDVFITLLAGVLGAYILVNIGKILAMIPVVGKVLEWIGVNTLPILLIHMCLIRIFTDLLHVQKQPMGSVIEETNWMSVLVYILAIISTCVLILLYQLIKKAICAKKGAKNESTQGTN